MTIDRRSVRDIGLAVLLALPTAWLTRPPAHDTRQQPIAAASQLQVALADRSPLHGRFTLRG